MASIDFTGTKTWRSRKESNLCGVAKKSSPTHSGDEKANQWRKVSRLKCLFFYCPFSNEDNSNSILICRLCLDWLDLATILDVWKSEGWIKPELIEDTNLDQVTLVMKMEKESDEKSAEKSADLKNREGMALSERHQQILAIMEAGIEYSTEQVAEKIGLKGPRTRQLLNELVNKELLACMGTTKRRRYIKPVD